MSQRKFNHFTNLCELLADTTDIIVANIFSLFFIITIDRISLVKKRGLWGYNTELGRVDIDNLELNGSESTSYDEGVTFLNWTIAVLEIRNQVCLSDVASNSFNGVCEGKNMDLDRIWHVIWAGMYRDNISHAHTEVSSHHFVHQDAFVFYIGLLCDQSNAYRLLSFLSYNDEKQNLVNPSATLIK